MSLYSSLSISLSGLQATSAQLQLAASNVSNANQEGYTKKTAVLTTADYGTIGGGTKVNGFIRSTDTALFTTLTTATSNASYRSTQDSYLQQVMTTIGTSSSDNPTLSDYMTKFATAWSQMEAEPESTVNQRQVVQYANNLAEEIQREAEATEALDRQCFADINSTLNDLNSYLGQVQDLNIKIAQAVNAKQSSGDLEDQRDQIILKISEITGVKVLTRPMGQIALYTATGYQLVDGSSARTFSYDGTDVTSSGNPGLSLNTALGGGSLQAMVDFRATSTPASSEPGVNTIQKMRSQYDAVVTALTTVTTTATSGAATFATAYNSATTGTGELASGFFTGASRTTIAVNASLLDGTAKVKTGAASAVNDAMLDSTRTFTATGLSATSCSYNSLVTQIMTGFQQAASDVATLSETATNQESYLKEKLANETGVNVDTEMVNLVTLQNAYAASAHCMSVVKDLFGVLENLL